MIEELKIKRDELEKVWYNQRRAVTEKLYSILNTLNTGPAPLLPLKSEECVQLSKDDYFHPDNKWMIRDDIYFVNQDPTRNRDYDFASDFMIEITNKNISINHGSSGLWNKNDKGQFSRLILMKAIFDNEENIISALDPLIDMSVYEKLCDIRHEIDKIEREEENRKREEEKQSILKSIVPGRYICYLGYTYKNEDDSDIDKWETVPAYKGFEKIVKITDKNIITIGSFSQKHLNPINKTIHLLKNKKLYIVDDINVTPPEGDPR